MSVWSFLIIFAVALAIYLMPFLIGRSRRLDRLGMMLFLNVLLGWTVVGWVVLMIWALIGQTKAQRMFYERAVG